MGGYLAIGRSAVSEGRVLRAAVAAGTIVASTNVLNDVCDRNLDRLNKPYRVIPSGRISVKSARSLAGLLGTTSLSVAATLGLRPLAIASAFLGLSAAYCVRLKNSVLVGNGLVALLSASTCVYGAAVTKGSMAQSVFAGCSIFPFFFAFEILKCIEDREADARSGVKTVATVWGQERSLSLCRSILGGLALGLTSAAMLRIVPVRYTIAVLATSVLPSLFAVATLDPRAGSTVAQHRVWTMKVAWLTGLSSMLFLPPAEPSGWRRSNVSFNGRSAEP